MDFMIAPKQDEIKLDMIRVQCGYFTLGTRNDNKPHRPVSTYMNQFYILEETSKTYRGEIKNGSQ